MHRAGACPLVSFGRAVRATRAVSSRTGPGFWKAIDRADCLSACFSCLFAPSSPSFIPWSIHQRKHKKLYSLEEEREDGAA